MDEAVEEDVAEAYAPLLGTDNPEPIPGQYIVVFKDTATKAQKDTAKGNAQDAASSGDNPQMSTYQTH